MHRKALIFVNVLLGALVSFFVGCKTHKVNKSEPQPEASNQEKFEPQAEQMICLYGIPPEVYKRLQERDSIYQDSLRQAQDTIH